MKQPDLGVQRAMALRLVAAALLLPLSATADPFQWVAAAQDRLAAGEVVIRTQIDGRSASAGAAVRVHARPEELWALITDCQAAAAFIPGLRRCEQLQRAPDGSWAVIEHDVKYSVWMPVIRTLFRAQYQRPYRVDLWGVGGDLKRESGAWVLLPSPDGRFTTVESDLMVEPGFWVPRSVVRYYLNQQLPAALLALRARAEQHPATAATQP